MHIFNEFINSIIAIRLMTVIFICFIVGILVRGDRPRCRGRHHQIYDNKFRAEEGQFLLNSHNILMIHFACLIRSPFIIPCLLP